MPKVSLALQGGGSHGAFTWGVLDRLLEAVDAGRFEIAAISGTSAGAINACVAAAGLAEGGTALARTRLLEFWQLISERGAQTGNALFYAEPGPFGYNIDWNPGAIALEALGLVVSPYTNLFYRDALAPILEQVLPPSRLAHLNGPAAPSAFICAVDIGNDRRRTFSRGEITVDTLRASCCLPAEFKAVQIGSEFYWDGGYLGNPALEPLLDQADDLLLVLVNPMRRKDVPPRSARAILDRLNEITFNASVALEMNSIAAINGLLKELQDKGIEYEGSYRHINLHLIQADAVLAQFGFVSKNSTSWSLLTALRDAGHKAADRFLRHEGGCIGQRSSADVKQGLIRPMLKG